MGTKNALKNTVKHKSFGNYGYFMRESRGTLVFLNQLKNSAKPLTLQNPINMLQKSPKLAKNVAFNPKCLTFFLTANISDL